MAKKARSASISSEIERIMAKSEKKERKAQLFGLCGWQ